MSDTNKPLTWSLGSPESGKIWASRWEAKQDRLSLVDWKNFRQDEILMEGLNTRTDLFASYLATNVLENIPLSFCEDSGIGNPTGRYIDGKFYTSDSLRFGRTICNIKKYFIAKQPMKVIEIGCGYGGLALNFTKQYVVGAYTLIDVPVCGEIQKKYHSLCDSKAPFPFRYINYETESDITSIDECDLIIAVNSLGEMTQEDIDKFFGLIKKKLKIGGTFYSCNMENNNFNYPYGDAFNFISVTVWGPSVLERVAIRIK